MNEKQELLEKIKEKKELAGVDDHIILKTLDASLKKQGLDAKKLEKLSSKDKKLLVKLVREKLRYLSGQYINTNEYRSTEERKESYPLIKKLIDQLQITSIIDFGCGENPLELATSGVQYYAYDIRKDVITKINYFFKRNKIPGIAKVYDIRNLDAKDFPKADLCLLFKILDLVEEKKGHKKAEEILKTLDCQRYLISFSTKTLSGKSMRHPQRGWIERLLTRLDYSWESIPTFNEIFYLASKNKSNTSRN